MQFHVLSFEGADAYSRAGGIATRIEGLTRSLASTGFDTHLWFVGDPELPGHEVRDRLHLHRWCQWISRHHPGGVYDGEEGKRLDFASSLPPFLMRGVLGAHLRDGGEAVVLAEEWHTADAVLHLDWLLRQAGVRHRVTILWNANNVFGFDAVDWARLCEAAVITTVSRYMRHVMWDRGVDPLVIPNGLADDAFLPPDPDGVHEMQHRLHGRTVIAKMARFDPDKRWLSAIDIVRELKRQGQKPLFVMRGGSEAHGHDVLRAAHAAGLQVSERNGRDVGVRAFLDRLDGAGDADVLDLRTPVDPEARRVLFRGSDVVLANSGHEPFGLVGLETMAAGGLACTGLSGEDYAMPGRNAIVLQTSDPREFVAQFRRVHTSPGEADSMRHAGRATARHYAWAEIVRRNVLPCIELLRPLAE